MAYLGRFMQGSRVPLSVLTANAHGTPGWPSTSPLTYVYSDAGLVASIALPAVAPLIAPGLFGLPLFTDQNYTRGRYRVVYRYTLSGTVYGLVDTFEVVGGGDPAGHVVSMTTFDRPEARYVLAQLEAGRLAQGRNPRL